MSYAPLSTLKARLGDQATDDDFVLQAALDWADAFINTYCDRWFTAKTATRLFGPAHIDWDDTSYSGPIPLVYGPYKRLFMDADLLTVTAVVNGDGTSIPADGTGFFYEPFNAGADGLPYTSILLHQAYAWIWTPDAQIQITGTWGYSATPDALIVNTALLLAEWQYRARAPLNLVNIFSANNERVPKLEGFPMGALAALESRRRLGVK